jgi:hypothetical protein
MTKRTLTAVILSLGAAFVLTTPARANIIVTLPSYDSPTGYDFNYTFPPAGSTTIGTFTFSIPAMDLVTGVTISGTFGNGDSPTTALSDYYLGFSGDETAVKVAGCDSISAPCYIDQNGPTSWTYTLTSANLSALASAIASGSLDFTYTWGNSPPLCSGSTCPPGVYDQYVYAGAPTINIQVTPEPTYVPLLFSALAGIVVLRRFRGV